MTSGSVKTQNHRSRKAGYALTDQSRSVLIALFLFSLLTERELSQKCASFSRKANIFEVCLPGKTFLGSDGGLAD